MDDEEIEDLRRQGMDEEQIDAFIEAWEGIDEQEDGQDWLENEDWEADHFPVLTENWDAAQVFLRLNLSRQIDQGMTIYTGVDVGEIRGWMHLLRIAANQRLDTADSVQLMVRTACQKLNTRNAERYTAQIRKR